MSSQQGPEMASTSHPGMEHPNLLITQANQQASPLLRLPAEVRLIIYDYTFIESTIHIGRPVFCVFDNEPPSDPMERIDCVTALLRACIQIRHETRPAFFKYCTFNFKWDNSWPNIEMAIDADTVKNIQLITISEQAARVLQLFELSKSAGPHHQAKKDWIGAFTSLRRVTIADYYMRSFARRLRTTTVQGMRRVFDNNNLDVRLRRPWEESVFPS